MLYVIPASGPVLLNMMKSYGTLLADALNTKNKEEETLALDLIGLILHIFYSLNCVELPAFFEDSMAEWMTYFKYILEIKSDSEPLRKSKTRVIKDVSLYCEKYSPEFKDYVPTFFNLIWVQVELTTMESEYDKVKGGYVSIIDCGKYPEVHAYSRV